MKQHKTIIYSLYREGLDTSKLDNRIDDFAKHGWEVHSMKIAAHASGDISCITVLLTRDIKLANLE